MLDFSRFKIASVLLTCLAFIYLALPNFLSDEQRAAFPDDTLGQRMNLGLDLRGGVHLLLEMDFDAYQAEQVENLRSSLRAVLRETKVGFMNVAAGPKAVSLTLRRETLGDHSLGALIRKAGEGLEYEEDGDKLTVHFSEDELHKMRLRVLEQSIEILNRRINALGTTEPSITRQGDNRILVQVPGLKDPAQLKDILGKTAKMTFHLVNTSVDSFADRPPLGTRILEGDEASEKDHDGPPRQYAIFSKIELSGEMLTNAYVTYEQGQPVVAFSFNTAGARVFGEITKRNVGRPFAVVLDDKVITAPVIRGAILDGNGIITGDFTAASANNLAILLRAGALPVPLHIAEERTIGPSLGTDSIEAGRKAALVGVALVMVFMLLAYGLFGVFANIALLVNLAMIVGVLSLLQATLTLPGIAGIVLTLGMAVDANVLIFERMREEFARGRTVYASVDQGFRAAFGTIIDSNLTTLIAAAILFSYGTGTIKGFAVTLSIGIISSMFSAILLTRLMIVVWLKRTRPKALPI